MHASEEAPVAVVVQASEVTVVDSTKPTAPQPMAMEDEQRTEIAAKLLLLLLLLSKYSHTYEGKRVIRTEDIAGYWLCCCFPVPCGIVHKEAIGPHMMRWRHRGFKPGAPFCCAPELE